MGSVNSYINIFIQIIHNQLYKENEADKIKLKKST